MFDRLRSLIGRSLAAYLEKETARYRSFALVPHDQLSRALCPGDVLLVEGNTRIATAIKYLTLSTWSHSAFFAGGNQPGGELIEADLRHGVHAAPLSKYAGFNTRICRPVGLQPAEIERVVVFMQSSLGRNYDLRNVVDLARYLLPQPPVPQRWRRHMLAMGSGDPTRAICSTLIAEAFQSVRYPILPEIWKKCPEERCKEILRIRHHSLFVPRDFDLSPYFRVVKPTVEAGFDPYRLTWAQEGPPRPERVVGTAR
ncbi:MAG: lipo-like protein [Paracoccaceae bacterium]|nr:lipo-like protein [Paracoccaceae bacterium]